MAQVHRMDFVIREMKDSDWERIKEIYKQAILEGKSTFQTECPTYENWDKGHLKDCRFVMLVGDVVIGWCATSATSTREAYKGVIEVSVYFDQEFRGKGLGTHLLNHLCEISDEKGYWCLYAAIFSINEASINLHKKCGFREIGYREKIAKDRFGKWRNTTLLERRNRN